MWNTPASKRRRLAGNVNKPFKSPLRTSTPSKLNTPKPSPLQSDLSDSSVDVTTVNRSAVTREEQSPRRLSLTPTSHISRITPGAAIKAIHQHRGRYENNAISPEVQSLSQENRALERAILQHRQEIDTLTQAVNITTKSSDAALLELGSKWRAAARLAAEELFASAKEKVQRMGGVGAWKDTEQQGRDRLMKRRTEEREDAIREAMDKMKKQRENFNDDGDEASHDGRLLGLEYDDCNFKAEDFEFPVNDDDDYECDDTYDRNQMDQYADDDAFTMDMMLKAMGIDLAVIGYNKEHQGWIG